MHSGCAALIVQRAIDRHLDHGVAIHDCQGWTAGRVLRSFRRWRAFWLAHRVGSLRRRNISRVGVDRTRRGHRETDAIDPERTTAASVCCNALALVLFAYRQLWNAGWALSYSGLIFAARITCPISRYRRRK